MKNKKRILIYFIVTAMLFCILPSELLFAEQQNKQENQSEQENKQENQSKQKNQSKQQENQKQQSQQNEKNKEQTTVTEPKKKQLKIGTAEELLQFAKDCTLDTYSKGLQVVLTKDITLDNIDFVPIPIFSGTFDGKNHTISGISYTSHGSNQGFIRYLTKDAVIKNLNLSITIEPTGSQTAIGGLVGRNDGTIKKCSVAGSIKGETEVGGLAGINGETGKILDCITTTEIFGTTSTGGIAGKNLGYIGTSQHKGTINILANESASDTGGIAGYSTGQIEGCSNYGAIGYQHTGYNTGGIVGRQNGSVVECINYGAILGRKDAGGIVGQFEPDISMSYGKNPMDEFKKELDELSSLLKQFVGYIGDAIDDGAGEIEEINTALGNITNSTKEAGEHSLEAIDKVYISGQAINGAFSDILTAMDICIKSVDTEIDEAGEQLQIMRTSLDTALRGVDFEVREELDQLDQYADKLDVQFDKINEEIQSISKDIDKIEQFLSTTITILNDNTAAINSRIERINEAAAQLNGINFQRPFNDIETAFREIDSIFTKLKQDIEDKNIKKGDFSKAVENTQKQIRYILEAFQDMSRNLSSSINIMRSLLDNLSSLLSLLSKEMTEIIKASEQIKSVDFGGALSLISTAFQTIGKELNNMAKSLHTAYEKVSDELGDGWRDINKSANEFGQAMSRLGNALTLLSGSITDRLQIVNGEIDAIEDAIHEAMGLGGESAEDIYKQLDVIGQKITNMTSGVTSTNKELRTTSNAISDQLESVSNAVGSLIEVPEVTVEDISDEAEEYGENGRIINCKNQGKIEADVNVGGIVGIVALELDLDPEIDLEIKDQGLVDMTTFVKATIKGCRNDAEISVKNDSGGGIVGRGDVGAILDCISRGSVKAGGNYAGGIAGQSSGIIRRCFVLSDLEGTDSIGGIAGEAKEIKNCYTMVRINSEGEKLGAIAGSISGKLSENYFLLEELAGVDGINYEGKAMPLSYQEFSKIEEIPKDFFKFTVTFKKDGEIVKTIPVKYGETLDTAKIPELSNDLENYYTWSETNFNSIKRNMIVEAKTASWSSAISSNEEKPVLLAEGTFSPEANLELQEWNKKEAAMLEGYPLKEGYQFKTGYDFHINDPVRQEEAQEFRLRLNCAKNEEVYLYEKEKLTEIETQRDGSYVTFYAANDSSFVILEKEVKQKWNTIAIVFGAAAVVLFLMVAVISKRILYKKRKNK